jgi:L-lactate dehydrogenase complex protein LldG
MSTEPLSTFESSVPGEVHRTTTGEFDAVLAEAVDDPAVGTALPYEDVTLPDAVDTDPSPSTLESAAGIADYGTVTIPSGGGGEELVSLYTPRHVAVVAASDVVADMPAAYERLGENFAAGLDTQVLATGPSATADMGTLVQGVHGPSETHVVVLEDR